MDERSTLRVSSLCVHGGYRASAAERAVVAPIAQTTTFLLDDASYAHMLGGRVDEALIYSRIKNPTLDVVQRRIALLEGAERALVFASGMAAIHCAIASNVTAGARVVAHAHLYGSTWDLLANFLAPLGIETEFVDLNDETARRAALSRGPTALVWCESISNPGMSVADVPAIARDAHAHGALLAVDATFASPVLQQPLALGADLVVHSATKYLAGHSDVTAGALAGSQELVQRAFRWLQLAGGVLDPHAAFLLDRGIKTLPLRMRAHCENALELARVLERHPLVAAVLYPGLESHPTHAIARRVLASGGGMLAFVHKGGDAAALRCVRALELALEASSLGGVETLVSLPFNTSHVKVPLDARRAAGIAPGLVRVSAGIEDARDLVEDFERALGASRDPSA